MRFFSFDKFLGEIKVVINGLKTTPIFRFKGFHDAWEQRKLSDIYKDIGNAFVGTATPYYVNEGHFYLESNNVKDGQINHNSEVFINDEFYEKQQDKWLRTGDMVMVQSGHVGHAAVIPEELDKSAAHALIMFRNPKVKIEPYFLNYQYQTTKAKKKIDNITTGNTIKHILASDMQEFVIDITSCEEQSRIAGLFRLLDDTITLHQRKLQSLQDAKKSMLQKMFPKAGEQFPELRFKGFTYPWEQRKLSELANYSNGTGHEEHVLSTGTYELVTLKSIDSDGNLVSSGKYINEDFDTLKQGTLIMMLSEQAKGMLGMTAVIPCDGRYVLNQRVAALSLRQGVNPSFLTKAINIRQSYFEMMGAGTKVQNITKGHVENCEIFIPDFAEQCMIGSLFDRIDTIITLHQRKLDQLNNIKKALLQNMFI